MKATSNKILFIILTTLAITLSIYTDHFATIENIYDITNNYSMLMILSCGLFIVLLSGGIDISFPAMTIISQYIMISFISHYDIGFINVFLISSVVGTLLGFTNAILVNKLNVPSIIITISTLNIFYGALLYITKGVWLYDYPEWFQEELVFFKSVAQDGSTYGLSFQIIIALFAVLLTGIIVKKLTIGRQIYALGGNKDAASRIGFNILKLHLFAYGYMGLMSGLAGIVQSYTVQSVAPDSLLGYELTVLAAVVLGGTSLTGGKGTLLGTVMGVALLAIIQNGLNLLNVSSYWQMVITGCIIILSISLNALTNRKSFSS
ncbi:monosaccharide ABC transporter membrane protein, CUT2 family [Pasteurella multocida]|uniref:ABC transporter permease n=1 Tax=Pasteurella TaxID=745 RepID=UPI000282954F|nr:MULTISPECIES: ABC transporter permease [Pasteurella]AMM82402.1 sugar ABC transporter permease [Pasteurella multocida subsp. multocida PMTB2.1]APW57104.1 sugar ABC transporter permease [Pasteurella multocida]ARB73929.1 ABC transporter permease [Pasteurella multocida]ATC20736.1 ABC transporter permease [Pasteurella multocida]AXQ72898.1 sugar ABC transporter permease [Pasteurella multocida subsp. multocida]